MANTMERRTLLSRLWGAGAGLIAAAGAWTSWDLLQPLPTVGFGGRVRSVPPEAVPEGGIVEVPAARAFLTRVDGELLALSEKCTHLGCRTPFCESSGRFECPCHGSVFSRAGDYLAGPAPRGMDHYPVDIEEGLVYINTGERTDGDAPGNLRVDEPARGPSCAGETH
ncbi:MAG: ubiquinol-cytochrome c reductase iron-sulfur subunit [Acidimicrobiales bacterium]